MAAFAEGTSHFTNFSTGADCASTLACMQALGAKVSKASGGAVEVTGVAAGLLFSDHPLDCGNSGDADSAKTLAHDGRAGQHRAGAYRLPRLQEGSRVRDLEAEVGRPIRAVEVLPDVPLVRPARPEEARGRPAGAGRLLHHHARPDEPELAYYLSFNVGYPNAYDRAWDRDGGSIMVHGICSSAGCFSMTDPQIAEIYAIAREAFNAGQREIQFQSYPFRMTAENLAKHRLDPNIAFWKELKNGADHFEVTKAEVPVLVCNRHYVFGAKADGDYSARGACPKLIRDHDAESHVAAKASKDEAEVAALVAKGEKPIRLVYDDGGQNPVFAGKFETSRPDGLAAGPREIVLDNSGKPLPAAVEVAAARRSRRRASTAPRPRRRPRPRRPSRKQRRRRRQRRLARQQQEPDEQPVQDRAKRRRRRYRCSSRSSRSPRCAAAAAPHGLEGPAAHGRAAGRRAQGRGRRHGAIGIYLEISIS